jgi:hypothetical protein
MTTRNPEPHRPLVSLGRLKLRHYEALAEPLPYSGIRFGGSKIVTRDRPDFTRDRSQNWSSLSGGADAPASRELDLVGGEGVGGWSVEVRELLASAQADNDADAVRAPAPLDALDARGPR